MNCRECLELMSEYLDGEMGADETAHFQKHFGDCPSCAQFFQSFKSSVDLVKYLEVNRCPDEVMKRLDTFIQARVEKAT